MPAGAGTPRYEKPELWHGTANWHGGFCHATPRPQRGTSPRATFPSPHPFWIPAPYPGTGHAFDRWNDELGGGSLSRIVVRDMLSYQWRIEGPAFAPRVTYFGQCGVTDPLCALYGSRCH